MKTLGLSLLLTALSFAPTLAQSNDPAMQDAIRQVISDFENAIAQRDVASLETLLHPDFRVMANRFRGGEGTTLLPRATYLDMMQAEKIGGTKYEAEVIRVAIHDHTAAAEVNLTHSESADMHVFLLLVQDSNNEWKIISNLPVVAAA